MHLLKTFKYAEQPTFLEKKTLELSYTGFLPGFGEGPD